jgi:hypothetical protein
MVEPARLTTLSPLPAPTRPSTSAAAPNLRPTAALVFVLALFSFFVTCFFFLRDGALYWDNGQHFSQFRDNLHSLNAYGELAWWFPHVQGGWPSYYYSILGFPHGASPLFAVVAASCWLSGRIGLSIDSYLPIYVVYFGLLTPLLFLFSVRAFVSRFLKDPRAVTYALVMAAFSPGVVLNISDIGFLEPAAYGLFLAAASLAYLKAPSRRTYWTLGLTLVALGLSLNFAFLFWNALAIPLFVAVVVGLAGRRRRSWILSALKQAGLSGWVVWAGLFLLGAAPNLVAYAQGHDALIKPHLDGVSYPFEDLRPGNPLTPLASSVPGLGAKWAPAYRQHWAIAEKARGEHIGYIYMGLLCVPLTILALTHGRRPVRACVMTGLLVVFGVINLAGHSPLFAPILALPTPLRSNNHYSDLLDRGGGFVVLIAAAALGLDALLRGTAATRRAFLRIFAVSATVGLLLFAVIYEADTLLRASFGFSVLLAMLTGVILREVAYAQHRRALRAAFLALLSVGSVDLSTNAFMHVRRVIHRGAGYEILDQSADASGIGLAQRREDEGGGYYFVSNVLSLRSRVEAVEAGLPARPPSARLFASAHALHDLRQEAATIAAVGFENTHSLGLSPGDAARPEAQPFMNLVPAPLPVPGRVEERRRTYNRVALDVQASQPALLFLADSYSPYWQATVDGRPSPVLRALHSHKAIAVPAGASRVELWFSPPGIGSSLLVGYSTLVLTAFLTARRRRPKRPAATRPAVSPGRAMGSLPP